MSPQLEPTPQLPRLEPLRRVRAGDLEIAYFEDGPPDGEVAILLHGFPYDIHSYVEVAPLLTKAGYRVIVPYLRGHAPTRFTRKQDAPSGQQAALAVDLISLMDALSVERATLAGYDWGARAACATAALWPERCRGIVTVGSYLVQDIAAARIPIAPELEAGFWYFFYFATERGRAGLAANREEIARVIWRRNSPEWQFDEATLKRAARAFDGPDYVDVVVHSYRHRLGLAEGDAAYETLEARLAEQPPITVAAVTLDGLADGNFPPTDGRPSARYFTGPRVHHQIGHAGHNLPQERPEAFAEAVLEVDRLARPKAVGSAAHHDSANASGRASDG